MILHLTRRCMQAGTLLLIAGIAFLSLYAHYRAARFVDDPDLMRGLRAETAAQYIHPYVEQLDDPQAFLDANKGSVWSMRLFGVSLTDPLASAEMLAASKHIHWPLLVSIIIPVILTIIFGKVFCSWICPGYVLFEIAGKFRKLLRLAEIKPQEMQFSFANKYIFLVVGLALAAIFSAPLFSLIYPPAVISRTIHAWIFGTELTGMVILLAVILAIEVFISPRWWCRSMCPGGALYGLLGWLRPVRVKLRKTDCTGCQACIPVCEAGINPITQSSSIECDNCGVCIRHCEPGALLYTIGLPRALERKPGIRMGQRPMLPSTDTRATTSIVLGILLSVSVSTPVAAHHILGLPHYSYKENYPQRPTLEYPATSGPNEILLTSYPGIPVPGEPANLAFYIKNTHTDTVYPDPVSIRILRTSTFGDNEMVMPPTQRPPFDQQHKYQFTFSADGEYIVELTLMVEGRDEVIPFLMVVGEPTATASFAIAGAGGGLLLLILIRAVQVKRRRKVNAQSLPVIEACGRLA